MVVDGQRIHARITALAKRGSVANLHAGGALALVQASERTQALLEQLARSGDGDYATAKKVIAGLLRVTSLSVGVIEAANADDATRKKAGNANAELGCVAAESLLKLVPQIEALHKATAQASRVANTLVGTSSGLVERIAQATAEKSVVERE